jgi:glucokinase
MRALVLDVGRHCIRFASVCDTYDLEGHGRVQTPEAGLDAALEEILPRCGLTRKKLSQMALAIAAPGPFEGEEFKPLGMPGWRMIVSNLREQITSKVEVVHDVCAGAFGLSRQKDLRRITHSREMTQPARARSNPKAFIQTGIGLGAAALMPGAGSPFPLSGEAGSATIAPDPMSEDECRVFESFGRDPGRWQFRSAQALLSTDSLRLYSQPLSGDFDELSAEEIVQRAKDGDEAADRALTVYAGFLGTFAGDIALAYRAYDGVSIAGYVPSNLTSRSSDALIRNFRERGPAREQLDRVGVYAILDEYHSLEGLAALVAFRDTGR